MKKLKAGIVGFGRIGQDGHFAEMKRYPDMFEVIAVADTAPDRLQDALKKDPAIHTYPTLDDMLKASELDIITIGTRHRDHVPMAIKIMEAGKIAVIEKPIATSLAELDQLLAVADHHPNKLFFRHNRRFEPAFNKIKNLMDSGLIGEIQCIKLNRSVGYCRRNDWMTMKEFYGGLLTNWGPHLIDHALQLLESSVVDIWADVRRIISIGDGDDFFKILLRAENGRIADIEVTGANTMPGREVEIIGNRGTMISNGGNEILVKRIDPCVELKDLKPHPENPPLAYGNFDEKLYFVEEKYQTSDVPMHIIWQKIYESAVDGKPYPITPEQVRNVVWVTEEAFNVSGRKK